MSNNTSTPLPDENNNHIHVGATVRVPRPIAKKAKGRATVATVQADYDSVCVLWESLAPKPLRIPFTTGTSNDSAKKKKPGKRRLQRRFLVTPLFGNDNDKETEETESTVALSDVEPLLDFELANHTITTVTDGSIISPIVQYKEQGDQLLRMGDASAACSYYELALQQSSVLLVGSAVIVKQGGHAKVADVDCLDDDDDNCIEISMLDSGEETVVQESDILLCIFYNNNNNNNNNNNDNEEDQLHLQERILLNLARCLLQLAELSKMHDGMASERRPRYLRSAVLATTLALTIGGYHRKENNDEALTNLEQTSFLLRSQAQAGLAKYQNAVADIKHLLNAVPNHKEGIKQLQILQGQQQRQKQVDKKLVKSMCQWVKTATNDNDNGSGDPVSTQSHSNHTDLVHKDETIQSPFEPHPDNITAASNSAYNWNPAGIVMYIVLPILIGFIVQKFLG